jgi:DNA repair protein SbcD/Mre11
MKRGSGGNGMQEGEETQEMKLIHTADLLLDSTFDCAGLSVAYGRRRREALRESLHDIFVQAAETGADAVLLAGNVYDARYVTRETVGFLRETFEMIRPIPVFIAPGPRDPFNGASPWATEAWPANVFLFDCGAWTSFELRQTPLTVHGFGFESSTPPEENPFGTLDLPGDSRMHIAMGHAIERCFAAEETEALVFDAGLAIPPGLRYLALGGHPEALRLHPAGEAPAGAEAWYCGVPESHGFHETGKTGFLEVTFGPDRMDVLHHASGRGVYASCGIDCEKFSSVQAIADAVRAAIPEGGRETVMRAVLHGFCHPAMRDALPRLHTLLEKDLPFLILEDNTRAAEDYAETAREKTGLGVFLQRINREIADAPDARRLAVLERARECGVAACRGLETPVAGLKDTPL